MRMNRSVRKAVNLTVDSELLGAAWEAKLNLSATLESALKERLGRLRAERWLADNRRAITAYNDQVAEHGVFSDGQRSF
jgi:antitoxin CcdA